jgi:hypothetical protein
MDYQNLAYLEETKTSSFGGSLRTFLSRRELIELRTGRKKPHPKTQELLVAVLKKLGLI